MQLTNIARDIIEDAQMGRVYLPLAWLKEAGIRVEDIAAPESRDRLAILTVRLLGEAKRYYRSGDEGLWHLSFRCACAVSAARHVYSEIGARLIAKERRAWDERTYVTGSRKIWVVARAIAGLLSSVPARLINPWSAMPLRTIWRYSHVQ
jgi:phytoene synthase